VLLERRDTAEAFVVDVVFIGDLPGAGIPAGDESRVSSRRRRNESITIRRYCPLDMAVKV